MGENKESNDEQIDEIQFEKISLHFLRQKARRILSQSLYEFKIIPSEDGFPRDWRGIADLAGIRDTNGYLIEKSSDPMEKVLQFWCSNNNETASFDNLMKFLMLIDRWDVLDDIKEFLIEDAKFYEESNKNGKIQSTAELDEADTNVLTFDDVRNAQKNLPPQRYDAFVLCHESDKNFAEEIIDRMEQNGLKLCYKERDLIGGISFEHEAVMRLISERCNRLIVIYTPEFLKSPANTYLVNYAQSLGIEKGQRKILPCLYKYCQLPTTLSCMWCLDYNRSSKFVNFWDKLRDSIQQTSINEYKLNVHTNNIPAIDQKQNLLKDVNQVNEHSKAVDLLNSDESKDLNNFVHINMSDISKLYNEEDLRINTPLISTSNSGQMCASKKSNKKWTNLKKWLPKTKSSKDKSKNDQNEKEKTKRKSRRQKLLAI